MARRALLVEDDPSIATVITAALEDEAFSVSRCDSIAGRDRLLAEGPYDVMLTDVVLTDGDGIVSLVEVHRAWPEMPVIILSAQNTLDTAVRATDTGAFEYFPKPFDLDELVRAACQAADSRGGASAEAVEPGEGLPLIGRSQAMQDVYRMITRVLRNDLTVLILGESGTGKELVAEAIHQLGARKQGPFVAVNTAAIPRELIESELFGHEKGAFTGAVGRSIGKFEQAPAADNGFGGALASWLGAARPSPGTLYHEALAAFERPLFEHALHETGGNQLRAAQLLGINRNTLRKRLDDLEIDPEVFAHRN